MDLGIIGRTAIVCASSRGLGKACATSLARKGVHVTLNEREKFGEACAFLCSKQANKITGQNLLLDGGVFDNAF